MTYKVPFVITLCYASDIVMLKYIATKVRYNIRRINPYKSDTKVEDFNSIDMFDGVNIRSPVIYFCLNTKAFKKSI